MATPLRVLAATAHPDDIEFVIAGTLLLLKQAGAEIHMWNLANGCMGSVSKSRAAIAKLRWVEAQDSARLIGATMHKPLFDDLGIFYDLASQNRVAAVIRDINPNVVLTHAPLDYMEDHQNTSRLVVTGTFVRAMKNFITQPKRKPAEPRDTALYHAMPHGLADQLRQTIHPHFYVDITSVIAKKREMLGCHRSQKEWLDVSQGMDSYIAEMEKSSAEVGRRSGKFKYAEGFRRHSHMGFGPPDFDPICDTLKGLCLQRGSNQ